MLEVGVHNLSLWAFLGVHAGVLVPFAVTRLRNVTVGLYQLKVLHYRMRVVPVVHAYEGERNPKRDFLII